MAKVLRVFDFDDTLATTVSYIYVKHKDGTETTLSPEQYAKYNEKPGDEYDFRDFNRMLNKPQVIKKNFKLLQRMLKNPQKKVTILTARKLGFPIRKFFFVFSDSSFVTVLIQSKFWSRTPLSGLEGSERKLSILPYL